MADIFISYSSHDAERVDAIAALLVARGFDVWSDRKLHGHRVYGEEIEENLNRAKAVLVIWSAHSASSQWVRSEADRARLQGKLIQAAIDDTALPMPFDQIQCIPPGEGPDDMTPWDRVCTSAAMLCDGTAPQPEVTPPRRTAKPSAGPRPLALLMLYWIGAVLLGILPMLGWLFDFAPPDGLRQTVILLFTVPVLFLFSFHLMWAASARWLIILAFVFGALFFGLAIVHSLLDGRFVTTVASERVVLGCGWRQDALARIEKAAVPIDTADQCPGEFDLAIRAPGVELRTLYTRGSLYRIWIILSLVWGASWIVLPVAVGALLHIQQRG